MDWACTNGVGHSKPLTMADLLATVAKCRQELAEAEDRLNPASELGNKAAAAILLADKQRRIVVPSPQEWRGVHLLERDNG